MEEIQVALKREYFPTRTLGTFSIYKDKKYVGKFCSLELPWEANQRNISCIPEGIYEVIPNNTKAHPNTYRVLDVPERSGIVIHIGNWPKDTLGCILLGLKHADIDGDGLKDVANSTAAIEKLHDIIGNNDFELIIC